MNRLVFVLGMQVEDIFQCFCLCYSYDNEWQGTSRSSDNRSTPCVPKLKFEHIHVYLLSFAKIRAQMTCGAEVFETTLCVNDGQFFDSLKCVTFYIWEGTPNTEDKNTPLHK